MYSIELLHTSGGYRFNYKSGDDEKIITWAGTDTAMNIPDKGLALRMKESLEKYPMYFDDNDNLIIPSPLYFLMSVANTGSSSLSSQIENHAIFWSQDSFFHRAEDERILAAQQGIVRPVEQYLLEKGFRTTILPNADYSSWEDLSDEDLLQEEDWKKLQALFDSLSEKVKIAVLYLAFNSPHVVAAMAWVNNAFPNEESFAHYSLVMEGIISPHTMHPADFEREVRLREDMFTEVRFFMG
ncbi:MAG: hypothetical protein ACK40M_04430 [Flavobacteriales bacterium]